MQVRCAQKRFEHRRQRVNVAVGKGRAAWPNRFGKTAALGSDDDTPARNSFERDDTEWFVVAGGNDENFVLAEQAC